MRTLTKLWREVKRPFRRLWNIVRGNRKPHSGLYCDLARIIQQSISTTILHQKTFSRFKNIHHGQEIVLVACGPTANDYQRIDNAIHIGVNRAFQLDNIDLHYLFMQDYTNVKSCIKEANRYKPDSCIKFYGILDWNPEKYLFPESDVIEANALRYVAVNYPLYKYKFCHCIDSGPLDNGGSVALAAMQFALWTNPKTIYLVGCDCTEGWFNGQASGGASHLVPKWIRMKKFAEVYYPQIEIKSINPVGLKGVFDEMDK